MITLDQLSRFETYFNGMHKEFVLYICPRLNKTCVAYCTRLAESFQRFRNENAQEIYTRVARHHLQRFSVSDAAASTQCKLCASGIVIAFVLFKQCLI